MNYPLLSEYVESIRSAEDNLAELSHLHPVLVANGDPVMTGGNFAVVFKMQDKNTGKYYALKCFTKEQVGRAESYKLIAEELEFVNTTYFTHFKYYDKELFVDCANSDETEFPVVLMDWVEGITLDKYIREHIDDQYELSLLAYQFSRLAMWLMPQPFAHGDLKPDNILVNDNGSLVLVDYDGMYVPAMKGQKARELGSPDFRHPSRTEDNFDEHIDDFALASILLSLKAISLNPDLLEQYGASDRLLFSEKDYRNFFESKVMDGLKPLMEDAELVTLQSLFLLCLAQNNLSQVSFRLLNLNRPKEPEYEYLSTEVTDEDLANAWTDQYGGKYSKDLKRLLWVPSTIQNYSIKEGTIIICDEAFYDPSFGNFNLKSVIIPLSVTHIGNRAFAFCYSLEKINIPNSVIVIGNHVFQNCSKLNSIYLPTGIKNVGDSTFASCYNLDEIVVPKNVEKIGANAFLQCGRLKKVWLPDNVTFIDPSAFIGCTKLECIFIPDKTFVRFEELLPEQREILMEVVTMDNHKGLRRLFSVKEIESVNSSDVVQGTFTKMVRINMNNGCITYLPLYKHSRLVIGDSVDLQRAKLIVFSGDGIYYGKNSYGDYYSEYIVEA